MQFQQMTSKLTCPHCDEVLSITQLTYDNHAYCEHCYEFMGIIRLRELCCSAPDLEYIKHPNKDGRFQLRKQCNNCYTKLGRSYSQKGLDITIFESHDTAKNDAIDQIRINEWTEFTNSCRAIFTAKEKLRPEVKGAGRNYKEYEDYIRSKEWTTRRKKVLERDNNICQSCLNNKATEVHHITYKHFKDEPLFELVSVCKPCHQDITMMDHGEYEQGTTRLFQNLLS